MKWFKLHSEFSHDPKLATFSKSERCDLIDLLCLANESENRGSIELEVEDIAATLSLSLEEYEAFEAKLARKGIVHRDGDALIICNWEKRQYQKPSDAPERVAERVARHREARRNTLSNADVTRGNALDTDTESDRETEAPEGAAARARETPPAELTPDIEDLTEAEWYVVECVRAVPGAAGLEPADIVVELRESILNRGSPVTDELIRSQFQRFRNHWSEKRKSQRGKWRGWRNAISNWVSNIRDDTLATTPRNGNGAYDPTAIWLEWAENPDEQDDIRQGHGAVIDVATSEER